MDSRILSILRMMILTGLSLILVSCQDTIPNRATITPDQFLEDPDPICEEGESLVEDDEGNKTCVEDIVSRPDGAIKFKSGICGCKDGKPVTFGNCITFCASKGGTGGLAFLYADFTVTEDISLNPSLENVFNWCNLPLEGDTTNPRCQMEAKDETGNVANLEVVPIANSNSVRVDISDLLEDKTYLLTLFEQNSKAKSDTTQIIKTTEQIDVDLLGTLRVSPVSQYTCIIRDYEMEELPTGGTDYWYSFGYRKHFYYIPRNAPPTLIGNSKDVFCHDIVQKGMKDNAIFPRLENNPGIFSLWDSMDPRFFDNNGNQIIDITDVIYQKTKNFGGSISKTAKFFNLLPTQFQLVVNNPVAEGEESSPTTALPLGYYMAPWIDTSTSKSFCLTSEHYNSTNALYKAFRDVIGVDTEGIYIAEKEAETTTNSEGDEVPVQKDYLLIRETDLKSVWFHVKNGVLTKPTDANVANVTTYFYYPLNTLTPFVKSSTQKLYRVKSAAELTAESVPNESNGTSNPGVPGQSPPHDKKIGCIPKL